MKHLSRRVRSAARVRAPCGAFDGIADLAERGGLDRRDLEALAAADALAV